MNNSCKCASLRAAKERDTLTGHYASLRTQLPRRVVPSGRCPTRKIEGLSSPRQIGDPLRCLLYGSPQNINDQFVNPFVIIRGRCWGGHRLWGCFGAILIDISLLAHYATYAKTWHTAFVLCRKVGLTYWSIDDRPRHFGTEVPYKCRMCRRGAKWGEMRHARELLALWAKLT